MPAVFLDAGLRTVKKCRKKFLHMFWSRETDNKLPNKSVVLKVIK